MIDLVGIQHRRRRAAPYSVRGLLSDAQYFGHDTLRSYKAVRDLFVRVRLDLEDQRNYQRSLHLPTAGTAPPVTSGGGSGGIPSDPPTGPTATTGSPPAPPAPPPGALPAPPPAAQRSTPQGDQCYLALAKFSTQFDAALGPLAEDTDDPIPIDEIVSTVNRVLIFLGAQFAQQNADLQKLLTSATAARRALEVSQLNIQQFKADAITKERKKVAAMKADKKSAGELAAEERVLQGMESEQWPSEFQTQLGNLSAVAANLELQTRETEVGLLDKLASPALQMDPRLIDLGDVVFRLGDGKVSVHGVGPCARRRTV